ncbi:MAG: flagellar hook assembly protein FlgD [Fibromonadaceae bacterium]|jgi:flagellar basal-body rod modification protein FlgD|nr:flagellar hook assembly protein FlgD [Fibromonadaceae bacterium]
MAAVTGYNSLFDLEHKPEVRKVSASASGGEKVVSEGDTKLFKASKDEMGKDSFLNLLVAQLKYQDPLNPAEDTQFVSQLAQFSQLEFTQNSTQAISTLASSMQAFMEMQTLQAQSITNASATPLLGKDVRVMEAAFDYKSGGREFNIHLLEGNKTGTVVIKDKEGKTVAELEVGVESSKGGDAKIKWDGKDTETKNAVLAGQYSVEVFDASGMKNAGYAYQDGTVSGVSFSSSGAGLTIGGLQYGLGYLVSVEEDSKKASGASSNPDHKISDDVMKKIASIMKSKDEKDAIVNIAKALGWKDIDADGDPLDYEGVNEIVEILNKPEIKDEEMIKKLAELLGKEDEDFAEMLKKVKNILG